MTAETGDADSFERDAPELLEEIRKARRRFANLPGALSGDLDRFRDRLDRLIRQSEVNNYRQIRIFLRDARSAEPPVHSPKPGFSSAKPMVRPFARRPPPTVPPSAGGPRVSPLFQK